MSGRRPAGRARRLVLISALSLLVAVLAAGTGLWWFATSRLASEVQSWRLARIAEGYDVSYGTPSRGGWPLRAELTLPDMLFAVGTPGHAGGAAWRVGAVQLVLSPWQPSQLVVLAGGEQSVQLGTAAAVPVAAAALSLTAPLDEAGQQDGVMVTGHKLGWNTPGGAFSVEEVRLHLLPLHAQAALRGVGLPGRSLPYGGMAETVSLQADATAALPPGRDLAAAAAAWRDGGGRVILSHMALRWGPLDAVGEMTLGLDAGLQPEGAGTLHLIGYQQTAEAMVRSGAITRNQARVAETLLSLVSGTAADGVAKADLPIGLHGGIVAVGGFPVLKVPALAFP